MTKRSDRSYRKYISIRVCTQALFGDMQNVRTGQAKHDQADRFSDCALCHLCSALHVAPFLAA